MINVYPILIQNQNQREKKKKARSVLFFASEVKLVVLSCLALNFVSESAILSRETGASNIAAGLANHCNAPHDWP